MTATNTARRWLALRQRLNMDQLEFADLALTSRSTISRVESGDTQLKYANIQALEQSLGSPISVLLGDADTPAAPAWYFEYLALPAPMRRKANAIISATIKTLADPV